MIRAFTNATPKSIRQHITLLRRSGVTIYYNRTSGYYSLDKNKLLNNPKGTYKQ